MNKIMDEGMNCLVLGFRKFRNIGVILMIFLLTSCYTSRRVNYLQSDRQRMALQVQRTPYLIQPHDILDIKVQSRDQEQNAIFNTTTNDNTRLQANPASNFLTGYPVDPEGNIKIAIVGEIKVSDMTIEEIRDLVQSEIDKYLVDALVSVKMVSFKISVLGDVKNPGTNYVFNTQSTIFEALSAAGDLNLSARRNEVKLIRQKSGESIVINLDLRDPSIITSPYYFLHPNDVIYVEPSKQNLVRNNLGIFTVILSAISTGLLVFDFVQNN